METATKRGTSWYIRHILDAPLLRNAIINIHYLEVCRENRSHQNDHLDLDHHGLENLKRGRRRDAGGNCKEFRKKIHSR